MKNFLLLLAVLIGATIIMFVSVSRATLEIMSKDDREGRLRIEPVIVRDQVIYKLPQTNMLPDNIFYGLKEVRDWLWFKFSPNREMQIKTMLILSDKRIAESRALVRIGKKDLALKAGMEAVNKLKYAYWLTGKLREQPTAQQQLVIQIRDATLAYSEIIMEIGQDEGVENQKYILLQQTIDDFKKEQIKNESKASQK
jgi:hypothetical protein